MSYLVKGLMTSTYPTQLGKQPHKDNWSLNIIQEVDDDLIQWYLDHTDAYTVLGGTGTLTTGVETVAGMVATSNNENLIQKVTFTFLDATIAVTDALAYASKKIFTFPKGRILLLGSVASLQWGVTTDRTNVSGTINDSASLTWALGSAAASNITLSSTMIDMLAKATTVLDGAVAAYTATATKGALASSAQLDGTGTAIPVYLNVGFETNTQIDNDGILKLKGTVEMTYVNLGG